VTFENPSGSEEYKAYVRNIRRLFDVWLLGKGSNTSGKEVLVPDSCSKTLNSVSSCSADSTPVRSAAHSGVPPSSDTFALSQMRKTKPTASAARLTPRHLAAARLLVGGQTSAKTAAALSTTPQTINRWLRSEAFQNELRRLHELLATGAAQRPAARALLDAPVQPRPRAQSIDQRSPTDIHEYINEVLRKYE